MVNVLQQIDVDLIIAEHYFIETHFTLINLEKTNDSERRKKLWKALRTMNIGEIKINVTQRL